MVDGERGQDTKKLTLYQVMSKHRYDEDGADGERCKFCGFPKPEVIKPFQVSHPKEFETMTRVVRCENCDEIIGVPCPATRLENNRCLFAMQSVALSSVLCG